MDRLANDMAAVIEADRAHVWHHLAQHKPFSGPNAIDPRIMVEGQGLRVWDIKGKEHLDAVSGGVWTVNVGFGRARIADAIRDEVLKLCFWAGAQGTIPAARFAQRLIEKMPGMSRVYFSNSGSEANEKAWKMVRQISAKHHGGRKSKILYRDRDYHGTTLACLSAGGQQERNAMYGPFAPGFVQVPHCLEYRAGELAGEGYGERAADAIEEVILREGPDTVGCLCLEPITAGGGIIVPPKGYWERVQDICRRHEVLLHVDEVVCGLGRTGTWFGYQQFGVRPDIVTMAKGVASGYAAISCTVTTDAVFEMFKDDTDRLGYFRDISTFGGCTGGPAAALENLAIIEEEDLLGNSERMGALLHERLLGLMDRFECVGEVRGMGLFQGAELVSSRETREPLPEKQVQAVVADCLAQGVIIGASNRSMPGFNNTLLLAPALVAGAGDVEEIVGAVAGALGRVVG